MSLAAYKCEEVTRTQVAAVPLPLQTKTYQPVPHSFVFDTLEDAVNDNGYRFGEQHHALSHDGARYFATVELLSKRQSDTHTVQAAVRNSLDKRFRAAIAFGSGVMCCANLCFWGEYEASGKHTPNVLETLLNRIFGVVSNLKTGQRDQDLRFECYQGVWMSDRDAHDLACRLALTFNPDLERADDNVLPVCVNTSRVERVLNEWHNPSYDHGEKSVWRFHNAVTEALKGVNVHELATRTIRLQETCDDFAGFTPIGAAA
jgi:hypothetical protein